MRETVLVAIPTRNRPGMLAEALASVVAQDDPDWVAVVGDDGDGVPASEAVRAMGPVDARVSFCRATTRSPGGARNAAVVHGEDRVLGRPASLVAFLDDDDLWLSGHLSAARRALAAAPGTPFCHGAAITRAADGETPYQSRDAGPFDGSIFSSLLRRNFVATSSVVVRGDALCAAGRFREDLHHREDLDLWLRLLEREPAAWVAEPTVVYRAHGGNTSVELIDKAAAHVVVLESWWRKRHLLSKDDARTLRRELARGRRRLSRRRSGS